jgi:hypothetical protein
MANKKNEQFSLSLPKPEAKASVASAAVLQSVSTAQVYFYTEIRAERDRQQDAAHFGKILQLVKHFK